METVKVYVCISSFIACTCAGACLPPAADSASKARNATGGMEQQVPGEVIVQFRDGTSRARADAIVAGMGASITNELGMQQTYLVRLPNGRRVEEAIQMLQGFPEVVHAEPNRVMRLDPPPRRHGGETIKK